MAESVPTLPGMTSDEPSYPVVQRRVADACAEAERRAAVAEREERRLAQARRERATLRRALEDAALAAPPVLEAAKAEAQRAYRRSFHSADELDVRGSASVWLAEIDRLNWSAARAVGDAAATAAQLREVEALVERLELSAHAASIAAASARETCLGERHALAERDEALPERSSPALRKGLAQASGGSTPIEALIKGDRAVVDAIADRLADEVGLEASRLQLALLELREAIVARAFEAAVFDFPSNSAFWGQFSCSEARSIAQALAVLGRGFDGRGGWLDGRVAEPRELSIALSLTGHDKRSLRHRPSRAELEHLWQGVTIAATEFVHSRASDLSLESMAALLGPRAHGLSDLWDNWGRMRRLLLSAPQAS